MPPAQSPKPPPVVSVKDFEKVERQLAQTDRTIRAQTKQLAILDRQLKITQAQVHSLQTAITRLSNLR